MSTCAAVQPGHNAVTSACIRSSLFMEFVTNAKQPTIGEYALKRGVLIYLSIYLSNSSQSGVSKHIGARPKPRWSPAPRYAPLVSSPAGTDLRGCFLEAKLGHEQKGTHASNRPSVLVAEYQNLGKKTRRGSSPWCILAVSLASLASFWLLSPCFPPRIIVPIDLDHFQVLLLRVGVPILRAGRRHEVHRDHPARFPGGRE